MVVAADRSHEIGRIPIWQPDRQPNDDFQKIYIPNLPNDPGVQSVFLVFCHMCII